MGDYGIKVSLPDNDINTGAENLVVSSKYPSPKVKLNVTPRHLDYESYTFTSSPVAGTTNLVTIDHGYDYTPASINLLSFDGANFELGSVIDTDLATYENRYQVYCNETSFVIDIERVSLFGALPSLVGVTLYYKYYIFCEDGD